jgi:hypothetical protein
MPVGHNAARGTETVMKSFFKRNIEQKGRLARALTAIVLVVTGVLVLRHVAWAGLLLVAVGVFVAVEAWRGWCFLRACGIKTKF